MALNAECGFSHSSASCVASMECAADHHDASTVCANAEQFLTLQFITATVFATLMLSMCSFVPPHLAT